MGSGSRDKGLAAADGFRNAVNNCNVPQESVEQKWNVCVVATYTTRKHIDCVAISLNVSWPACLIFVLQVYHTLCHCTCECLSFCPHA